MRTSFRNSHGVVRFDVEKLAGCCGVAVVYDVHFSSITNKEKFYKAFNNHLKTATDPFEIDRCKIIMTDGVKPDTYPSIYDFCTSHGWMEGEHTFNRKSGNDVVLFELSRQTSRSI